MLLRGNTTEDQLQFNPEIEKSAKSNRKKAKAKKKHGAQPDSLPSSSQQAPNSDTLSCEVKLHSKPQYWLILAQTRIPRLSEDIRRTKSTANKNHPPPKKHKSGTSGQVTPSYNRNKFTSLEGEERYNTLLQWTFVPERKVDLQRNEYPNFLTRLDELKWGTLTSPHNKFDPDVVSEDSLDGYHQMVAQNSIMAHGFRIAETVATLCLPGRSVSANVDGRPKRIYRKDMTTERGKEMNYGIPVLNHISVCKARSYGYKAAYIFGGDGRGAGEPSGSGAYEDEDIHDEELI
ncbi:hypothetical protein Lal_00008168 [Lupinus albus]|nr:hypothetical protein Lal_00008168 [Lupinus albus]